jgi:hypothetical protein
MSLNPLKYIRFVIKIFNGWLKYIEEEHISFFQQIREAYTLLKLNELEPYEYYCLKLFRPEISLEDKKKYMSMNQHFRVESYMNPREGAGITNKFNFSILAEKFDIPVPEVLGLFSPIFGFTPDGNNLKTVNDLEKLITSLEYDEFVIKPTSSGKSVGILFCKKNGDGSIHIFGEQDFTIKELYDRLSGTSFNYLRDKSDIYIIEKKIRQHKFLDNYSKTSTQSIRTTTLLTSDGKIEIIAFYLKIAREGVYVDNLSIENNMGVAIDETGTLGEGKEFWGGKYANYTVRSSHPDTGYPFKGNRLYLISE